MITPKAILFAEIENTISSLNIDSISDKRKAILKPLIDFTQSKLEKNQEIRINFICTHNSRRSHLSQIWSQVMAHYFNIKNVFCYSGGTKATALFPMVIETLKNQGLQIQTLSNGSNPVFAIKYAKNQHPVIGFSKTYEDNFNPQSSFLAVMTCSQADADCPYIAGAENRISIPFEDPKAFDNTPQQALKYNEKSLQIATELFYVFSQIKF